MPEATPTNHSHLSPSLTRAHSQLLTPTLLCEYGVLVRSSVQGEKYAKRRNSDEYSRLAGKFDKWDILTGLTRLLQIETDCIAWTAEQYLFINIINWNWHHLEKHHLEIGINQMEEIGQLNR